jgi:hypothetical protein
VGSGEEAAFGRNCSACHDAARLSDCLVRLQDAGTSIPTIRIVGGQAGACRSVAGPGTVCLWVPRQSC